MGEAKQGDEVKVHYTGKLADGTVFDTSDGRDPLEFKIGEGNVIEGFEEAVIGMSPGQTKTETILPDRGYGDHKPELLLKVERSTIPADAGVEVGQILMMGNEQGATMKVLVTEVTDEIVTLDANHPLAGLTLEFTIELVQIGT